MYRSVALLFLVPLLVAASAPVVPEAETVDQLLRRAQAEARAADAEVRKYNQAAARAQSEASRLRARQAAAAQAIAAAEARISAADAQARLIGARLAEQRRRLQDQQRPASALLAGLAMMARRPPLLSLAGDSSVDELVRVRILLDSSLPVIRRRTAALSAELQQGESLERRTIAARRALAESRSDLARKREEFALLEAQALRSAELNASAALGAGDVAIATAEELERIEGASQAGRSAVQLARELAALGPPPLRPAAPRGGQAQAPFDYHLPAAARVTEGLGEVSGSGIRSRGITLATQRGSAVVVPASGIVRFAGPFRDYDGIAIIDHGGGWVSLIVNVASQVKPGAKVRSGEPLGRALGPLGVELSRNGQHLSPALIAGSSAKLSNRPKGG